MSVVADSVSGVAEEAAPKFRMIAVANNDQVICIVVGKLHDCLGRMAPAGLAGDSDAMLAGGLFNFLLALLEILVRGFGFALEFTRQVGMARQWLAHPKRGELGVAFQRRLAGAAE